MRLLYRVETMDSIDELHLDERLAALERKFADNFLLNVGHWQLPDATLVNVTGEKLSLQSGLLRRRRAPRRMSALREGGKRACRSMDRIRSVYRASISKLAANGPENAAAASNHDRRIDRGLRDHGAFRDGRLRTNCRLFLGKPGLCPGCAEYEKENGVEQGASKDNETGDRVLAGIPADEIEVIVRDGPGCDRDREQDVAKVEEYSRRARQSATVGIHPAPNRDRVPARQKQ